MLQRPQTLYLLLVAVLAVVLLTGPLALLSTEGVSYMLHHSGLTGPEGNRVELATWPMTTLFVASAALALFNIFSYRNRIRQMRIAIFLIFLFAGMIAMILYYVFAAKEMLQEEVMVLYRWRVVNPPVAAILTYLAFRRIRRDELLVKAYDRIR
jgi:hypothetical protein